MARELKCSRIPCVCWCGFSIPVILFVIIMLANSFSNLQVNTVGLDYNPIMKSISPFVFKSGIHFLGFNHYFIEYPQSVQTVDFSSGGDRSPIEARSSDGLMVKFSVQF